MIIYRFVFCFFVFCLFVFFCLPVFPVFFASGSSRLRRIIQDSSPKMYHIHHRQGGYLLFGRFFFFSLSVILSSFKSFIIDKGTLVIFLVVEDVYNICASVECYFINIRFLFFNTDSFKDLCQFFLVI